MKINEVTTADDAIAFWKEKDSTYNPEALEYVQKQEKRTATLQKGAKGTPVFTKPVGKKQKPFTTQPNPDGPKSPGYRGQINAQVKTGHISREKGKNLVS